MAQSDFRTVLPYALVVFLGYVGFSMPLAIFPEMFLDPQNGILPLFYTDQVKTLYLGLVMTAFPLGQLFGAPILGKLSDRWGRKRVILCTLVGGALGYLFTALSVGSGYVPSILFGLFLCGLCEGNVAIAQSVVADLVSHHETKKKAIYFGWLNLFICFAFVVGPILGGVLSDNTVISWFSFAIPFWAGIVMTVVGFIVIARFSEETRKVEGQQETLGYWASFKEGLTQRFLGKMYLVNFFLALGYFSYFRYFPVYLKESFSYSPKLIGYSIAYGSVVFAIAAAFFLKQLSKKLTPYRAVMYFALVLAASFVLTLLPEASWSWLWTTIPVNISLAVVMTYASVLVSNAAPQSFQGQAMGTLTAVQVMAEVITGLGGGFLAGYFCCLPILVGGAILVIASACLFAFRQKKAE